MKSHIKVTYDRAKLTLKDCDDIADAIRSELQTIVENREHEETCPICNCKH